MRIFGYFLVALIRALRVGMEVWVVRAVRVIRAVGAVRVVWADRVFRAVRAVRVRAQALYEESGEQDCYQSCLDCHRRNITGLS